MTAAVHEITPVLHGGQAIGSADVKRPPQHAKCGRPRRCFPKGYLWATAALLALLLVGCGGDKRQSLADASNVTDVVGAFDVNLGNADVSFGDASLGDASVFDGACLAPGQGIRCQLRGVAGVPDAISCSCECLPLDAGATRLSCDPATVACCVWLPEYGTCRCVNDAYLQAFGNTCESFVGDYLAVPGCP
jgi:hypothetical protein